MWVDMHRYANIITDHADANVHVCVRVYIYIYIYIYVCVCVCVCVHVTSCMNYVITNKTNINSLT